MLALFDLDNTLIDRQRAVSQWAEAFARDRGLPPEAAQRVRARLWQRAGPADFVYLRRALNLAEDPEGLWLEYVHDVAWSVRLFPGVEEGLRALQAAGWTLGVVTNGPSRIQSDKLLATGLARFFDGVAISEMVGARKPDRALFAAAADSCGADLSAGGWMVGDSSETDVAGAWAAGLRAAWVSGGREWEGPRLPEISRSTTAEVIDELRGTNQGSLSVGGV